MKRNAGKGLLPLLKRLNSHQWEKRRIKMSARKGEDVRVKPYMSRFNLFFRQKIWRQSERGVR